MRNLVRCGLRCASSTLSTVSRTVTSQTPETIPIAEEDCHGMKCLVEAVRPYVQDQIPVVLHGAVAHMAAVERWKSWDYLESIVDIESICHVEVGGNYAKSERCDIRFGDYLAYLRLFEERHGRTSSEIPQQEELIYLAQNDALEGLYQDFSVPDFCSVLGEGRLYSTMMWIGPCGCVSPLHFDPMDNALMQFVGVKRVMIFPEDSHSTIYAGADGNQYNTSPLNPENPVDVSKYPLSVDLPPAMESTLNPGDILYIPKRWWHYIRTVETSVSVNCWWR